MCDAPFSAAHAEDAAASTAATQSILIIPRLGGALPPRTLEKKAHRFSTATGPGFRNHYADITPITQEILVNSLCAVTKTANRDMS